MVTVIDKRTGKKRRMLAKYADILMKLGHVKAEHVAAVKPESKEEKKPAKKAAKRTYKRRDMQAEEE